MIFSNDRKTNLLISTFPGLSLPSTVSLPVPRLLSISDLFYTLARTLPAINSRLLLSTSSGSLLSRDSSAPISSLFRDGEDGELLTLRLHAPLAGGKGGFGSQLRAAGGRMSSRKRKGQENNDSCRNLDGRRMRTVKEAKALAAFLEVKPDMDKKEKEKRRQRWESVIESADAKIRGSGSNQRFDDVKWLEEKEEGLEKTREMVLKVMKLNGGKVPDVHKNSDQSSSSEEFPIEEDGEESSDGSGSNEDDDIIPARPKVARCFGFDEDDEFMSSEEEEEEEEDDDEDEEENENEEEPVEGKGKGKANA